MRRRSEAGRQREPPRSISGSGLPSESQGERAWRPNLIGILLRASRDLWNESFFLMAFNFLFAVSVLPGFLVLSYALTSRQIVLVGIGIAAPALWGLRQPNTGAATEQLSAAFGVSLAFAATYRSAKRASRLPIVETLRHYSPHEATVRYRPTLDVILVAVGVGTYVLDLTAFLVGPSLLGVLAGPLFFVMLPFAPFLLLIGLTRLLTRATPRFYQAAARLLRPFARNLHHLISQNLRRNPRRASNIALLIALGLAFGIFVLSLNSSFIVREVRILRASIGADMAGLSPIGDETFEDNVTRVAGVAAHDLAQRRNALLEST